MKKATSVENYIENNSHYQDAIELLRSIVLKTELKETIKWNAPVYALDGKNVLSIGAFKNHFGIWFFNGVFLKDKYNLLANAQEGKTKAMRQMRFETIEEVNENHVLAYINEAIQNQKQGKEVKPERNKKQVKIPEDLDEKFESVNNLKSKFLELSNYKQREYCDYISSAKRDATKQSRLEKITPMILQGVGLNDKYKNC